MSGYIGSTPVPQATQHRESFTATAGQTSFATAGYTAQFVDVYLNGVHLSPADVTATNGSDVVLAACLVNDIVDVISYSAFEVNAQTFTGTTTLDGAVVINESSADVDFRVESNGNANMLFVDGGNDNVGIGTSSPSSYASTTLEIKGSSTTSDIKMTNTTTGVGDAAGYDLELNGNDINYVNRTSGGNQKFWTNSTERMRIDATGAVTMPHQPAFLVKPNTEQSNIALASNVTVLFQTEIFDQNADFANNTFTAPVSGKYQLNFSLYLKDINDAYQYIYARIQTANRNYEVEIYPSTIFNSDGRITVGAGFLADMDASDTASVTVQVPNTGSAQMDIVVYSSFSGYLVA